MTGTAKLSLAASQRNADAICAVLAQYVPDRGDALEIASGTGQHIARFASLCPQLSWLPSEIDPVRRASIDAYVEEADLPNLRKSVALDATTPDWGTGMAQKSLIILVNLLHLISKPKVRTLIGEAAKALAPGGVFIVYGPFMRSGNLTSSGDREFHASLTGQNPDIGYKDDFDTLKMAFGAGLELRDMIEMPANNLAMVLFRPHDADHGY